MKKVITFCVATAALIFSACEGDKGSPGPQGAPGVAGEKGVDGKDGNTTTFYFQNGYKGYEGAVDATIYNTLDIFSTAPAPNGQLLYVVTQENGADPLLKDTANVVLRFDGMSEIIEQEHGADICSGALYINEATLFISGLYSTPTADAALLQIGIYGDDAPVFDEEEVTWINANSTAPWTTKGGEESWAFNDPYYELLGHVNMGYHINLENVDDARSMKHTPVYIPREAVEKWLCEEGINKGLRLAVAAGEAMVILYSSEKSEVSLRPLLYLNIDKPDEGGRISRHSSQESYKLWQAKSYEEKMEPFYKLYPEERP